MELSTLRSHYLLKVNPAEVILANDQDDQCVPSWVFPALLETSFVVVRRAAMTGNRIPVGIRGQERSQRSAAWCPANAIEQIVTPADLLQRCKTTKDPAASPACRSLRSLAADWQWLSHRWGLLLEDDGALLPFAAGLGSSFSHLATKQFFFP
jgi:phosphoribosyl-dephospho-CoA transferase